MDILHLSDIHYRNHYEQADTGYSSVLAKMTPPLINLKKCFDQIDKSKLEGVVITGDLTEEGTEKDYIDLKTFLNEELGNLPVFVTLGNHDVKSAFYKGWELQSEILDCQEPYNAVYDLLGVRIISLDNAISGYPNGVITHNQYLWLKDKLSENCGKKIILIFHHPLLSNQANIPPAYWDSLFYELISDSEILGILCGHTHHQYLGKFAGIPYTIAPSMSFRGKSCTNREIVKFEEYPGYQICHFTHDGMTTSPAYMYKEPMFLKSLKIIDMRVAEI